MNNWKIFLFNHADWKFELQSLEEIDSKHYGIAYDYIGSPHFSLETYDIDDFIPYSFNIEKEFTHISIYDDGGPELVVHCSFAEVKDSIIISLSEFIEKHCV